MLDNKLVQIALVVLAFYVVMQIMNNHVSQEHLDTVLSVPPAGQATVAVNAPGAQTTVSVSSPLAANALVTPELAATSSSASATPVVTSSPSAALTTSIPAPLTAVEEDLMAAAPKNVVGQATDGSQNANIFAPEPVDLDQMFGKRGFLDPSELIPRVSTEDAELYGGFAPDPNLDQSFLQNRWSMGIDASVGTHNFINDLRGLPYPPKLAQVSPWQNPTQFPDLYRKSLCDVS